MNGSPICSQERLIFGRIISFLVRCIVSLFAEKLMKHAERAELKNCSECNGGFFFPEWCLTPLKVNTAAPANLNLKLKAGFFTQKMCRNQAGASLWAEGGEKRPVLLHRVHISLFRVQPPPPPPLQQSTPRLLSPAPAVQSGGLAACSASLVDEVSGGAATGTRIT